MKKAKKQNEKLTKPQFHSGSQKVAKPEKIQKFLE